MKSEGLSRHVLIAFAIALIIYLISFSFIEGRRQAKGPWNVRFESDASGVPSLVIHHPALQITNVQITFPEDQFSPTNFSRTLQIETPMPRPPFGTVEFFDTTFLPGTVTFEVFGHSIELMPRVMVINFKEVAWAPGLRLELPHSQRPKK